ncbi:MAG: hypothetical protein KIG84_08200 [Bacteroidales bacterium]|nr:hypothetical protein [Bacteroidales bacterium]
MSVSSYTDEDFKIYSQKYAIAIQAVQLPPDINTGMGQIILSQLDELYAYLRIDLADLESAYSRAESLIRQNERAQAIGRNEEERKRNATTYLETFQVSEGKTINMYDEARRLNKRYLMVKGFVDVISNKQQRLITMSGFMKVDSQLGNNF